MLRKLFDPKSPEPFKISRSGLEFFLECPRCFYLDRRLGVKRPSGPPFTLNSAVDALLKKEFDIHRRKNEPHGLMKKFGIDAIPFTHEDLDKWRANFTGVQYLHQPTNLLITGAVDDVWINPQKELIVVDYKATAKSGEITLDDEWKAGYKRQMEIYQWLLRANGFKVNKTGYFVYANGRKDLDVFDGKLEFDLQLLPYTGDDSWVEGLIFEIKRCLDSSKIPNSGKECEYCTYREEAVEFESKK